MFLQCSVKCGMGHMSREVKCSDALGNVVDAYMMKSVLQISKQLQENSVMEMATNCYSSTCGELQVIGLLGNFDTPVHS